MTSIVSGEGKISLPLEAREKLGLLPGTTVQLEVRQGAIVIRKGHPAAHPVDQVFGCLRLDTPVDVWLDRMRGPRPRASKRRRVRSVAR